MRNNKGLTLIEVIVALGILIVVFSGTTRLVMEVTRIAVASREKTAVAALAQKGLTARMSEASFGCAPGINIATQSYPYSSGGIDYLVTVSTSNRAYDGNGFASSGPTGGYVEVYTTVTRVGSSEVLYSFKQIVRGA